MNRPVPLLTVGLALLATGAGCSSITSQFALSPYPLEGPGAVKSVVIAVWTDEGHASAGPVLAKVAADMVKLRKNYLVFDATAMKRGWSELCAEHSGVLTLRLLHASTDGDELALTLVAELYRCSDGALVYRAEAEESLEPADEDLAQMVEAYARDLGEPAKRYAAPAFVVLQDLVANLPNPVLTDDEVMQKIELE